MKELFGKKILTELSERTDPAHTAVIVVDMQNDFCAPEGMVHRLGHDLSSAREAIPRLAWFLDAARDANVMIIYIKNRSRPDGAYNAPSDIARRLLTYAPEDDLLITSEGGWGEEIIADLSPQPGDTIVIKHRPDAFERTQLGLILRSRGIESVIVTGTATFACVESTARRALMEDYYITVVSDCVMATDPELHNASLRVMKAFFGEECVCPAEQLVANWAQRSAITAAAD